MSYYRTCPCCGAHLDSGESCDCIGSLYASLSAGDRVKVDAKIAELLKKQKTAPSAANTEDGGMERLQYVSTSILSHRQEEKQV